jgi:hypothetical protein
MAGFLLFGVFKVKRSQPSAAPTDSVFTAPIAVEHNRAQELPKAAIF